MLILNLQMAYSPSRLLSVDETMVGFRGWFAAKLYMPAKPNKYGIKSLSTVVLSIIIGIGMVPSIIDVWGYDTEFCSSSSPPPPPPPPSPSPSSRVTQKPNNINNDENLQECRYA